MAKRKFNTLAIIGFILSFLGVLSLVGITLCIIALTQINKREQRGKGLAIAGIIIGIIATSITFVDLFVFT